MRKIMNSLCLSAAFALVCSANTVVADAEEGIIARTQSQLMQEGIDTEVLHGQAFKSSACAQFENDVPRYGVSRTFFFSVAAVKADYTETSAFCVVSAGRLVPVTLKVKGPTVKNYEPGPRLLTAG